MTIKGLVAGVVLLLALCSPVSAQDKAFKQKIYNASVQLYYVESTQEGDAQDGAVPVCTATVFQKTEKGYLLLTAAHCVTDEHPAGPFPYSTQIEDGLLWVAYGNPGDTRDLTAVSIKAMGDWREGWDMAVLSMDTTAVLPVIPLGDDAKLDDGDKLVSVSGPLGGMVKYWFEGYISAKPSQIDPQMLDRIHDWKNTIFIQLPGTSGSSGAGVISADQQALVGIFTGEVLSGDNYRMAATMTSVSGVKLFLADPKVHKLMMLPSKPKPATPPKPAPTPVQPASN